MPLPRGDLPSRGCNLTELQDRIKFWKESPDFLKLPVAKWPKQPAVSEKMKDEASVTEEPVLYEDEIALYAAQLQAQDRERKLEVSVFKSTRTEEKVDEPFNCQKPLERCSSLHSVRGVITGVRRFVELLRRHAWKEECPDMTAPLTAVEVNQADLLLCHATQQQHLARGRRVARGQEAPQGIRVEGSPGVLRR